MPTISRDGVKVWYDVSGNGEPLVLMGGSGLVHNQTEFLVPILEKKYRVIQYDQRGAGRSDRTANGISLDVWVDDLRAVLDTIGIKRTHLFGTSHGSYIVIHFAAKYPERTGAVIHFGEYKESELSRKMLRIGAKIVEEFGTGKLGWYFYTRLYGIAPEFEDWELERLMENVSPDSSRAMSDVIDSADLTEDLPKVRAPQLLLMGDRRPIGKDFGYSLWPDVMKVDPRAELAVIQGAHGTYCVVEKPREAAEKIDEFLSRHPIGP